MFTHNIIILSRHHNRVVQNLISGLKLVLPELVSGSISGEITQGISVFGMIVAYIVWH